MKVVRMRPCELWGVYYRSSNMCQFPLSQKKILKINFLKMSWHFVLPFEGKK